MKFGIIGNGINYDTMLDKVDQLLETEITAPDHVYVTLNESPLNKIVSDKTRNKKIDLYGIGTSSMYNESLIPVNNIDIVNDVIPEVKVIDSVNKLYVIGSLSEEVMDYISAKGINVQYITETLSEDTELLSENMTGSARRKVVQDKIISTMSILDKTGYNSNRYKDFFKGMSDAQFDSFMKEFLADDDENFYLEVTPFSSDGSESTIDDIEKAAKHLNVPLHEYLYMPYLNPKGEAIKTQEPVPIG